MGLWKERVWGASFNPAMSSTRQAKRAAAGMPSLGGPPARISSAGITALLRSQDGAPQNCTRRMSGCPGPPGSIHHAGINGGRLFLFSNAEGQKMFRANPAAYVTADLALDGNCAVCAANMGKSVAGRPDIVAIHNGLRYLFPSEDQRSQFLAAPERFVSATAAGSSTTAGSATRPSAGSGSR